MQAVAMITGASRGIGLATAEAFAAAGYALLLCARDAARLRRVSHQFAHIDHYADVCNVAGADEVLAFVKRAHERFGRIDVLVNNAGVAWAGEFIQQSTASIAAQVDVNLKGLMFVTRAVAPLMCAQGGGAIVNISSGAGLDGIEGLAAYGASKFGVVGFTEALAQELAPYNVSAYAVCPGRVATDMQEEVSGARVGLDPARVARLVLRLAAERPAFKRCFVP